MGSPCSESIDQRLNWTLPLPPKKSRQNEQANEISKQSTDRLYPSKSTKKTTFKFLQISDTHVDPNYLVDSNAACNEPLCCRSRSNYHYYSKSQDINLRMKARYFGIKMSDDDELKAGVWGSYGSCDIPMHTFQQALKQIVAKHRGEIDYVIWTGK